MHRFSLPSGRRWTAALQHALEAEPDPIWLVDPETSEFVWAHPSALQLWGVESLEALRRSHSSLAGSPFAPERSLAYAQSLADGQVCLDRRGWSTRSGADRVFDILLAPTQLPNARLGVLHRARELSASPSGPLPSPVSRDLTRTELEHMVLARTEQLILERDQFDKVFETVSALVLLVDTRGLIVRANAWARSVLNLPDLVGRPTETTCGFPDAAQLSEWFDAGEAPSNAVEVFLRPRADQRIHILWTPRIAVGAADATYLVLTGLDITQLRDVETQLQITDRMATIGTLAAGVAHDLNNPLAYITSNAEMLMEDLEGHGQEELYAMARDCLEGARRAASIVSQLRTFARGGASGAEGIAHVRSVLEFAARMAHNHVKHHAQVDWRCPPDLYASMDESKLGQVVLNLMIHAIESIEPGQASSHRVEIVAAQEDDGWMSVSVEDDGAVLAAEHLRRIFDPYASIYPQSQGASGMGLAICHRIITDVGGRVEVKSNVGRGTKVQVWLPAPNTETQNEMHSQAPRPASKPYNAPLHPSDGASPRILFVDDEPGLRSVMRRALRGFTLDEANDGRQALEKLAKSSYDLVLCDVMMPEMTGVELYETVKTRSPGQAARFVFLSGGAFTPDTQRFIDATERLVLEKPFRMDKLRKVVTKVIEENQAER